MRSVKRKQTAWKKNRKLGDVYGGRRWPKIADNIFSRCHSLERPGPHARLPILLNDNPSRDFFFPISAEEAEQAIKALPNRDFDGITHIWCRRISGTEYRNGSRPWAEFICGSGVRVIVLYAWRRDMRFEWVTKPSNRITKDMQRFGIELVRRGGVWQINPTLQQLRRFYIQYLLYHEVGHHVDWYFRQWSSANIREVEEFADQYALQKTATATYVFNRLEKTRLAPQSLS